MGLLPPAIFFINGDITRPQSPPFFPGTTPSSELEKLEIQLFIDDVMSKQEFDARVVADPNYPTIVHLRGLRILVVLPNFYDGYNRQYADVVMFLHQGLADIEKNNFGPPFQSFPIDRINMYELLRAVNSPSVVILPFSFMPKCDTCRFPFFCDGCHTFSGIKICSSCGCGCKCGCDCLLTDNQGVPVNPIHAPNCDNEFHNVDFINRK